MSARFDEPHIYFKKTYVSLDGQNVGSGSSKSSLHYKYVGGAQDGSQIQGCLAHLNNINSTSGITLLMVQNLCDMFGLVTKQFFQGGEKDIKLPRTSVKFSQFIDNSGITGIIDTQTISYQKLIDISNKTESLFETQNSNQQRLADLSIRLELLEKKIDNLQKDKSIDPAKIQTILEYVQNIDSKV